MALLSLLTASATQPAPAIRFVGATSTARTDADGLGTFNDDCAALYPRSRVCTDVEIMGSFPAPELDDDAWIMMTVASVDSGRSVLSPFGVIMPTGSYAKGPNCSYASVGVYGGPFGGGSVVSGDSLGLIWNSDGQFEVVSCGDSFVVACCGP